MTIFVAWFWPIENFLAAAGVRSKVHRMIWVIDLRFVVPILILFLLLNQIGII